MKIEMLKTSAGPEGCFHPGQVRNVDAAEGKMLCEARCAKPVTGERETASRNPKDDAAAKKAAKAAAKKAAKAGK